ncbi:uncharacterized protein LOC115028905 isoform X2 [Cottoperca gobio]|uniref:Uncharacterized protein LOC115028905 isoform X2 n=1 Tax=Cottoperca gobio TaxID=56716 RepID=A0A6J2S9Q1_COTGO|nr:uncharacterized protein LOC115028905 isoform X2 [Cottoperca gobio]
MAEFRRIIMSSFLMLLLLFTASGDYSSIFVRVGDDVTLPFENVTHDQKCDSYTWIMSYSDYSVLLFEHGEIIKEAGAKSDRLSVTEKCSLVIKKVTVQDVGLYICRQIISGQQLGEDALYELSVVTLTEHHNNDQVELDCSVSTYGQSTHRVDWLYEGDEKYSKYFGSTPFTSSVWVTIPTAHFNRSYYELLKCAVRDGYNKKEHLFTFSPPQSSGEKPGDDATTTTSPTTTTTSPTTTTTSPTTTKRTTVNMSTSGGMKEAASEDNNNPTALWWLWLVGALVGVAALLITSVAVIRWKKTKGNKTQTDDIMADPEEGVSYASISYTRKENSKAQVHDADEGDAVTYSTVRAAADPSDLYATVNKPKK